MKAKTVLIAIAAATVTAVGTRAFYVLKYGSTPDSVPLADGSKESKMAPVSEASPSDFYSNTPASPALDENQTTDVLLVDRFGIDAQYMDAAAEKIRSLKSHLSRADEDRKARMSEPVKIEDRDNPAHQLALRLLLDAAAEEQLRTILEEHLKVKTRYDQIKNWNSMEPMRQELADCSEAYQTAMALYLMKQEGQALSAEQQTFYDEFMDACRAKKPEQEEADPGPWYENESTLAALSEVLTEEQREELNRTVLENRARDREEAAYKRTNKLTQKLGLSEADRAELYTYLYQNPTAFDAEIAEMLSAELQELLLTE